MMRWLCLLLCLLSAAVHAVTPDDLIKQGDEFDAKLQTKLALEAYLEADRQRPNDPEILYRIAKEYGLSMNDVYTEPEKRKRGETAVMYAKRAVAANPNHAQAQLSLAVSYGRVAPFMETKTKVAYSKLVKEHADKALALDPNNDLTHHVLGAWNFELANLNPFLRALASAFYGSLPKASNEAAADFLRKAIELNPNRLANHVELGRVYAAMGNKAAARASYEKGLSLPTVEKDDDGMKKIARQALQNL